MAAKKIKIGFDLDGVVLYNPVRIFRPIAAFLKSLLGTKKYKLFYFPKTKVEKIVWSLIHKTSFKPAFGLKRLKSLVKSKKIEAYIITARYDFLKNDFEGWMKKINKNKIFKNVYYNKTNLQPNAFKEKMINKLKLDIFVEDNWGVVQKLTKKVKKTRLYWITNIFDKNINYQYKFSNLDEALKKINP